MCMGVCVTRQYIHIVETQPFSERCLLGFTVLGDCFYGFV
jgi:hypothetical protein